jgi:uncharacterized membrane protein HdeD (DUF308 family)
MIVMQHEASLLLSQVPRDVLGRWEWFLVLGLFLILFGALACPQPSKDGARSIYFLGWLLVGACAIEAVTTYVTGQWAGFYLHLLAAILFGVTGYMLLTHSSAETVTTILAMYFIVAGIFNIVAPLIMNLPDRGWHVWSGFITLVLGPLVLSDWPLNRTRSFGVVGWFLGIDFFFRGVAWTVFALGLRSVTSQITH